MIKVYVECRSELMIKVYVECRSELMIKVNVEGFKAANPTVHTIGGVYTSISADCLKY